MTVITGAEVTKVLIEQGRAVGVQYVKDGSPQEVRSDVEVILTAGALITPKLLLLSGIGAAAHLEAHGIPVVANLPGVGQNLQDHLQLPVIYRSKVAITSPRFSRET